MGDDPSIWGVPGTLVTRRALEQHGYLDARSYLKTPRIFGFHGVYKRLAIHLGLVDVHLGPGPNARDLVESWARGLGLAGIDAAKPVLSRWSTAVRRSLGERPPHTRPGWGGEAWAELAEAFAPSAGKIREKRYLHNLLHASEGRRLGALPTIWQLQAEFNDADFREEVLHDRLQEEDKSYQPLLNAIRTYEAFARSVQDAFDVLKSEASQLDARGFDLSQIACDEDFGKSVNGLHERFEAAHRALGEINIISVALQNLFDRRFNVFSEPMDALACARSLCSHHEAVQQAKSADGKRPWFDRIGQDRIYIRHQYREPRRNIAPGRYVHDYRGWPIRRFYRDLS
jgi:hypothetical protein